MLFLIASCLFALATSNCDNLRHNSECWDCGHNQDARDSKCPDGRFCARIGYDNRAFGCMHNHCCDKDPWNTVTDLIDDAKKEAFKQFKNEAKNTIESIWEKTFGALFTWTFETMGKKMYDYFTDLMKVITAGPLKVAKDLFHDVFLKPIRDELPDKFAGIIKQNCLDAVFVGLHLKDAKSDNPPDSLIEIGQEIFKGMGASFMENVKSKLMQKFKNLDDALQMFYEDFINYLTHAIKGGVLRAIEPPIMNLLSTIISFCKKTILVATAGIAFSALFVETIFKGLELAIWGWIEGLINSITNKISEMLINVVKKLLDDSGLSFENLGGAAMDAAFNAENAYSMAEKMKGFAEDLNKQHEKMYAELAKQAKEKENLALQNEELNEAKQHMSF